MTKTIVIEGKPIRFRASAAVPRLYRFKFRRDIFLDLKKAVKNLEDPQLEDLEVVENVAYIMAKHADVDENGNIIGNIPNSIDEWLESFNNVFSLYERMKDILELWGINTESTSTAAKKAEPQKEK